MGNNRVPGTDGPALHGDMTMGEDEGGTYGTAGSTAGAATMEDAYRPAPPLITLDSVSMEFVGKRALSEISLEIHEGEIVGVIGRSGSGKTVLMHLLRGVDQPPTSGRIIYHVVRCAGCGAIQPSEQGRRALPSMRDLPSSVSDVDLWAADDHIRRELMARTAIMFQRTFALYGNDRVIENVLHALDDVGYAGEKAVGRAADLLDEVRLSHRMMHIARDLSGGEKQRVVLARHWRRSRSCSLPTSPRARSTPRRRPSSTAC